MADVTNAPLVDTAAEAANQLGSTVAITACSRELQRQLDALDARVAEIGTLTKHVEKGHAARRSQDDSGEAAQNAATETGPSTQDTREADGPVEPHAAADEAHVAVEQAVPQPVPMADELTVVSEVDLGRETPTPGEIAEDAPPASTLETDTLAVDSADTASATTDSIDRQQEERTAAVIEERPLPVNDVDEFATELRRLDVSLRTVQARVETLAEQLGEEVDSYDVRTGQAVERVDAGSEYGFAVSDFDALQTARERTAEEARSLRQAGDNGVRLGFALERQRDYEGAIVAVCEEVRQSLCADLWELEETSALAASSHLLAVSHDEQLDRILEIMEHTASGHAAASLPDQRASELDAVADTPSTTAEPDGPVAPELLNVRTEARFLEECQRLVRSQPDHALSWIGALDLDLPALDRTALGPVERTGDDALEHAEDEIHQDQAASRAALSGDEREWIWHALHGQRLQDAAGAALDGAGLLLLQAKLACRIGSGLTVDVASDTPAIAVRWVLGRSDAASLPPADGTGAIVVDGIPFDLGTARFLSNVGMLGGHLPRINHPRGVDAVGDEDRLYNCINCALATDTWLSGRPATALPRPGPASIELLEQHFGYRFTPPVTTQQIVAQLRAWGKGARGIVYGAPVHGDVGHVFNVAHLEDGVRFLDGQVGGPADLTPYRELRFLTTYVPQPTPDRTLSGAEAPDDVGGQAGLDDDAPEPSASAGASRAMKAINLPAWRKVTLNIRHVLEYHVPDARYLGRRDFFPSTMNEEAIVRAIREAYESSTKVRVRVQGRERVLLRGQGYGLTIEMRFNRVTNTIETAFPVIR